MVKISKMIEPLDSTEDVWPSNVLVPIKTVFETCVDNLSMFYFDARVHCCEDVNRRRKYCVDQR